MNLLKRSSILAIAGLTGIAGGCSRSSTNGPDVTGVVRKALDEAGLREVSASDDRSKGVITIAGNVSSEEDKDKAGYIAGSLSADQVVANQIAVVPEGER